MCKVMSFERSKQKSSQEFPLVRWPGASLKCWSWPGSIQMAEINWKVCDVLVDLVDVAQLLSIGCGKYPYHVDVEIVFR